MLAMKRGTCVALLLASQLAVLAAAEVLDPPPPDPVDPTGSIPVPERPAELRVETAYVIRGLEDFLLNVDVDADACNWLAACHHSTSSLHHNSSPALAWGGARRGGRALQH